MVGNSCQGWMETFVPAAERQQTGLYLLFQVWSPVPAPLATPEGLVTGKTSHTAVLAMGCKDPCADLKQLPLVLTNWISGFYVLVSHLFLFLTHPVQPPTPGECGDLTRGRYMLDLLQAEPEFLWVWGLWVLILPD